MIEFREDKNNRIAYFSLENIKQSSSTGIRKAFYFIGKDLEKTSKDLIRDKEKNGKVYLVRLGPKRRVMHQASAPGEAPANITGTLARSIYFTVRGAEQIEFGASADYAKSLELGTTKMAARPFLKPSIDKNERNAEEHFEREIRKAIEEEGGSFMRKLK